MSHWTKVATKLRDREILKKALTRMGLEHQVGDFTITQYGTSSKAEIKLDSAVGLAIQSDGTYSMVGDFYHSKNRKLSKYYGKTKQFASDLSTAYAIEEATTRLEEQQFYCSENAEGDVGEDGMITMCFESWN